MIILIFPETRRFMSSHQGFNLLHWITRNWLSGDGWIKALGDGWGQGCFTTATQETWEPNQPLTGKAVHGPVCSCSQIQWPFSWMLQVSIAKSVPLFLLYRFPFRQLLFCSSSLSLSQPIVQYFRLLCPSVWWHYISVFWTFGVVILTHLCESEVRLQRPVLPGPPRGPLLDSGDACHSCGQGSTCSGWVHWFEPDKLPALLIQMEQTAACSQRGFSIGMS